MKIYAINYTGVKNTVFKADGYQNNVVAEFLEKQYIDGKKRFTQEEIESIALKTEEIRKRYNMRARDNTPFIDALEQMLEYKKYPPVSDNVYLSTDDILSLLSIKNDGVSYRFNRWFLNYFSMRDGINGKDILKIRTAAKGHTDCGDAINAMLTINDRDGKFVHSVDDICELLEYADTKTGNHGLYDIINARIYDKNINEKRFLKKDELIKILNENGNEFNVKISPSGVCIVTSNGIKNYELTKNGIEHSSTEKLSANQEKNILRSKRVFSDGKQIYCVSGIKDGVIQNTYSAVYDGEKRLYYEKIKPSKDFPNLYVVEKLADNNIPASTNITEDLNSPDCYSYRRNFISPNGMTTTQVIINKPNKKSSFYKVTDKKGDTLFMQTRSFKTINNHHTQSLLNGKIYDIQFFDDKIKLTLPNEENIIIDGKLLDKRLMQLYKKLPGDILALIAKMGVKVRLANTADDCLYHDDKIIHTVNDVGIFMHEFGHAVDAIIMSGYSKALGNIYRKEFYEVSKNTSDLTVCSLEKFKKLHELVAEGYQILSGEIVAPKYAPELGARMINLQRYFPESLTFLAKQFMKYGAI